MFFKVFIIEKTNEKFLLEAAYFFMKNYNTTSYNYRINRLLQIIPQIFFKSPTQKKYIMAAPVESAENHRFIPLGYPHKQPPEVRFPEEGTTQSL